jgi:DNA-directed RNA polymerase I, II, and III subunit RPABC2
LVVKHSIKKRVLPKKIPLEKTKKSSSKAKKPAKAQVLVQEIPAQGSKVLIGPPWLTRFERARITGSRSLQLSLGAPPLIKVPQGATSSIVLAVQEIEKKALPISIRRILPNGQYQDIPTDWMR